MDPTDPGLSEGCYADDSLDPLHTRTLETDYTNHTSQTPWRENHTRQTDALDGHGPTSGILIDALDGHGSLSEIEADTQDRFVTRSYDSLAPNLIYRPDIIAY
jgi:hypothetical protein